MAWQRTALTAVAALLLVERLLLSVSIPAAVALAAIAVPAMIISGRAVLRGRHHGVFDGRAGAVVAILTTLAGAAALAYAILA